jgi:hypothetical protein
VARKAELLKSLRQQTTDASHQVNIRRLLSQTLGLLF